MKSVASCTSPLRKNTPPSQRTFVFELVGRAELPKGWEPRNFAAALVRVFTWSFLKRWIKCVRTVPVAMKSREEISRFEQPLASSATISNSRDDSRSFRLGCLVLDALAHARVALLASLPVVNPSLPGCPMAPWEICRRLEYLIVRMAASGRSARTASRRMISMKAGSPGISSGRCAAQMIPDPSSRRIPPGRNSGCCAITSARKSRIAGPARTH